MLCYHLSIERNEGLKMNNITTANTKNFTENYECALRIYRFNGALSAAAFATMMIGRRPSWQADEERIRIAQRCVKANASVFSTLRSGYAREMVCAAVASSSDPEVAIKNIVRIREMLKSGFLDNSGHDIAACILYMSAEPSRYEELARKTMAIYSEVTGKHPVIAWGKDLTNLALLALSDKSAEQIASDLEDCYNALRAYYSNATAALYAASALAWFNGDAESKALRTRELHDELKKVRFHFASEGLEIIALMAGMFNADCNAIILIYYKKKFMILPKTSTRFKRKIIKICPK